MAHSWLARGSVRPLEGNWVNILGVALTRVARTGSHDKSGLKREIIRCRPSRDRPPVDSQLSGRRSRRSLRGAFNENFKLATTRHRALPRCHRVHGENSVIDSVLIEHYL